MRIEATGLRKRFGFRWIVYDFDHVFEAGSRTAIAGANGSGKTTLVKLLSGQLVPSAGELSFRENERAIPEDALYKRVNLSGPYVELIDELSGVELVNLHGKLRPFASDLNPDELWARVGWGRRIRNQRIGSYSSGMMQRLRLLLALATASGIVFLDEPTSNLDTEGVAWYQRLVRDWIGSRTLVVASNEERDYVACTRTVESTAWLPPKRKR